MCDVYFKNDCLKPIEVHTIKKNICAFKTNLYYLILPLDRALRKINQIYKYI